METTDFLIIGGGVMGVAIALEIAHSHSDANIMLIEKEKDIALHASGRNSGVLHAGFYYTENSMKARFTRDGNFRLQSYCKDKGLKINNCGKLVICRNESELKGLKVLHNRGETNNVRLEWISAKQAQEIEPRVLTHEFALWSPDTASVDPVEVVTSLARDAKNLGVAIKTNTSYLGRVKGNVIQTSNGLIEAGYIINTAGLYADKIAVDFGFSKDYRILPFKGLYLYSGKNTYRPRVHIYPVPDLEHPFLGVHFTLTVDGQAKIGPTAIPSFWRENYQGFDNFKASEAAEIVLREIKMCIGNNFGFRDLAIKEMRKFYKPFIVSEANYLLEQASEMKFEKWGRPGIRAQLVDIQNNRLEMDFVYEGDERSFHLLNAVSPAFTCSLTMTEHLVKKIDTLMQ